MKMPLAVEVGAEPSVDASPSSAAWVGRWVVVAALAFVVQCVVFFPFSAEDAFIVLRYARNAARHGELVFNLGDRISALTSPLHALVEVVLFALLSEPLVAYKCLAVLLVGAAWAWGLYRMRARPTACLFVSLAAATPVMALWTVGGLETPLLVATLWTLTVLLLTWPARAPSLALVIAVHVLAGLAFLTRFDSVLLTAPAVVATWPSSGVRRVLAAAIVGALIPAAWLLFAYGFYGSVLPTSFHVKTPGLEVRTLLKNAIYLVEYGVLTLAIPLVVIAFMGRARRPRGLAAWRTLPFALRGLLVGLTLQAAYALTTATTHMMFSARLLLPYLPVMAMVAAELAPGVLQVRSLATRRFALGALLAVHAGHAALIYGGSLNGFGPVGEYRHESMKSYASSFMPTLVENGADLVRHARARGLGRRARVDTFAAGIMPYAFDELYVIEALVSWPLYAPLAPGQTLRACADYVQTLTPRHGSIERQLGEVARGAVLVSERQITFDGALESFRIYAVTPPEPRPAYCAALPAW